jgi:CrcB protein
VVYTFATFAIALACLYFGEYVASVLPHLPPRALPSVATENSKGSTRRRKPSQHPFLDTLAIISAILCYLIALILYFYTPTTWRHRAIFPILLSPPGTMLRYALSRLNAHLKFPLGTFLANMIATFVLAGVFAEQHRVGSGVRCNAMYSIQQGFCGCLSTVSSFAVEVRALKGWMKWTYIGASVVGGHILMLVVFGGVGWSKGYGPICTE